MGILTKAEQEGRMPGPQSALVVIDRAMKAAARQLEKEVLPRIREAAPSKTGRLRRAYRVKRRRARGVDLSIGPRGGKSRTDAEGAFYGHFVAGGTGVYGPERRPIRRKNGEPFLITAADGRQIATDEIQGQRPNPFLAPVAVWADARAGELAAEQLDEAARVITDRNL